MQANFVDISKSQTASTVLYNALAFIISWVSINNGNYSPHKKVKKSLTGFWGLKIEMTLLQLIVLFIGMPRSLQRISQGVTDFASKNRF